MRDLRVDELIFVSCDSKTLLTFEVVSLGECGLDYDRMFSPAEVQREVPSSAESDDELRVR